MKKYSKSLEVSSSDRLTNLGFIAIAFAALLWATGAIAASRLFQAGVTPTELTMLRSVIAAIGLGILLYGKPAARWQWDWKILSLGLCLAFVTVTYYIAISRLSVAVALVIQYTAPAIVVLLNALRNQRLPTFSTGLASLVALFGIMLVSGFGTSQLQLDFLGLVAAAFSALFFAGYTLFSEAVVNRYGALGVMFRGFVVSSLFWVTVQLAIEISQGLNHGTATKLFQLQTVPGIFPGILFVGIGGTLVPFCLLCWGIQQVKAERGAIGATLEPVLAAILAWLVLGQALTPAQILGSILVLGAVTSLQLRQVHPPLTPS